MVEGEFDPSAIPNSVLRSCLNSPSSSAFRRCTASNAASEPGLFSDNSLILFSSRSICSRVLCLMARCASRSFALFLASCSALRVETLLVPALDASRRQTSSVKMLDHCLTSWLCPWLVLGLCICPFAFC